MPGWLHHQVVGSGRRGFTLIELSIVLVIIGLIVGGMLVGQNLIGAAAVRAQIAQIEKYNTAANTFNGKYGYLPGDIPAVPASQFGFQARGTFPGEGDGNGIIEGVLSNAVNQNDGSQEGSGETAMFWVDLSVAHLIDGGFSSASETVVPVNDITSTTTPNINAYLPQAKIGNGNYIYVYSFQNVNWYGLSAVSAVGGQSGNTLLSNQNGYGSLTTHAAYAIDGKMDDGLPLSGKVRAQFVNCCNQYSDISGSNSVEYAGLSGVPQSAASYGYAYGNSGSCYDNNGVAGVAPNYSTEIVDNNLTCELSFQFQ